MGDRAQITLKAAPAAALARWLAQVRSNTHAVPAEMKLARSASASTAAASGAAGAADAVRWDGSLALEDRKSTRLNSSHSQISYAVFCLKKKKNKQSETKKEIMKNSAIYKYNNYMMDEYKYALNYQKSANIKITTNIYIVYVDCKIATI